MKKKQQLQTAESNIFLYIVVTVWVFVITLFILNLFGMVPYYLDGTLSNAQKYALAQNRQKQQEQAQQELLKPREERIILPTRLLIPSAGTDVPISNPNTTDIDALDRELLSAVVRYPGSGTLGRDGNMLIFGHSTGYRTVHNKMFKAFNALKTLEDGDIITLIGGDREYVYTVNNVRHEEASKVTIDFKTPPGVQQLTLSTCDSFGKKSDRYIVTADFIGSYPHTPSANTTTQ